MAATVTAASGYDPNYPWKGQRDSQREGTAERGGLGYYAGPAEKGEPPGRWFGKGAEALGLGAGQLVERKPYFAVYAQADPRDGSKLGRAPGRYDRDKVLAKLKAAEPHATAERLADLERQADQATRKPPVYTDVTVSFSKSYSIFHASLRENARQARLAGGEAAAAYWDGQEEKFQHVLQDANRAGMEHLQEYAVTRTGHHGARVDGKDPGRYEAAGMVATSWLQGTSRAGDPQDHIHNVIARMSRTEQDGKWRALDTMTVRGQLGAVRGIASAHLDAALVREFGVELVPRTDGQGNEIKGISREQIEQYSTRTQKIAEETPMAVEAWERAHGREPSSRELLYIQQEVTLASREGKEEGEIDWDAHLADWEAKWDARDGSSLARVALDVSNLRVPDGDATEAEAREPEPDGSAPARDAQARAMQRALARVQQEHSTWTRADLMRAMADCLPDEAHRMDPAATVALLHDMTDRAIAGEAEQVVCLDAPEYPATPEYLKRDLDGCSVYSRPGTTRYATQVQLSREEQLLATAGREGAPHLTREQSAKLLGSEPEALEAAGRERAQEATGQLPSGVRMGQAAALQAALTSPRNVYSIVGPAGSGKTHTLAQAARMWREAGMGPVVGVTVSQAARNVLAEAAQVQAFNLAQFLGRTEQGRGVRGVMPLAPGTLVLLDEATMPSIEDLRELVAHVETCSGKVVLAGDHGQLTAVESGGGMELITRELEHAQLAEPIRFTAEWEGEASLRLRTGDASVLTDYDQHGRIRSGGDADHTMDEARKAYLAAYLSGRDVLLMAQSHGTCRELGLRVREDLQHLGVVDSGASAALRDGARASAGDLIITRKNDHNLGVANGDTWRVEAVDGDQITMRKMIDADRETGARRYAEHTITYTAGQTSADLAYAVDGHGDPDRPTDLAYAITGHSAQGRTVAEGIAVITGTETREWAYVAMSRGANGNYAYVTTEPARVADPAAGVRPAPELGRHERIQRERAGQAEAEQNTSELGREPTAVLSDVLERQGAELSALEVQRRNLANADHLATLYTVWDGETRDAIAGRYERLLREHLPEEWKGTELSGHATWLYRTLRGAEAAGLDAGDVLARAISEKPLTGTRDVAAVVDARIREQTGTLVPQQPGPWAGRVPDIEDPAGREYVGALAEAMDERAERLGEFTADAPPAWAVNAFGPVPDEPLDRLEWQERAQPAAAYREMFGYTDPADPIGPEPVNSPEARAAWHDAFIALGPAGDEAVRGATDGRLLNMRATYEAETAWAPRYVGDELKNVRVGADEADRTAVLAAARAKAAREHGDEDQAALHELHATGARVNEAFYRDAEAKLAETMEARDQYVKATERTLHLALTANSEYMRRHPDAQLPPLRSMEPPKPTEEEKAELVPAAAGTEAETPAWMTEMAERNQAALDRIEEMRGLRVPNEDHEWEDLGEAYPDELRRERDAIIQPPKPEIPPAQPVAELAAEAASGHRADHEAGE